MFLRNVLGCQAMLGALFVVLCFVSVRQTSGLSIAIPAPDMQIEPLANYLGCYTKTSCSFGKYRGEKNIMSPKRPGFGSGMGCIIYCNKEAADRGIYAYAALEKALVSHRCYCFETLQKGHSEVPEDACTTCSDDCSRYVFIWQTCPIGLYDPASDCKGICPEYCMPKIGTTEVRCSITGHCVDGCKGDFCGNIVSLQQLGQMPKQLPDPHPAKFVMYVNKVVQQKGFVTKISFYGRTKGFAYVSLWSYIGIDDQKYQIYKMQGKVAVQNDFEGMHDMVLEPRQYIPVEVGDALAVHLDRKLMSQVPDGEKTDYTLFYTISAGAKVAKYSSAIVLQDDGWEKGRIILLNPKNELNLDVSIALTICGKCPVGCKDQKCTSSASKVTCLNGCITGFTNTDCSDLCSETMYGAGCSIPCNSACRDQKCHPISGKCMGCNPGFMGDNCTTECTAGTWGPDCSNTCGQCYKGSPCNRMTGECMFGCEAGLMLPVCVKPCSDGKFGLNCTRECSANCKSDEACDKRTGDCPRYGRSGERCTSYIFEGPSCFCKKEEMGYGPNCALKCGKCASKKCNAADGMCPDKMCTDGTNPPNCVCTGNSWGPNCEKTCGSCHDNAPCNGMDGFCPNGCSAGYQAPLCLDKCQGGFWGMFCGKTCGNCKNGDLCNADTGECASGCASTNAEAPLCATCMAGYYGEDCSNSCPGECEGGNCNKVTGECDKCAVSTMQPPDCQCPMKQFGTNCTQLCDHCTEGCKAANGKCLGACEAGWQGEQCNEPCPEGMWGPGCVYFCGHCQNGDACDRVTGHCSNRCEKGYRDPLCKCTLRQFGEDCTRSCGNCLKGALCDELTGDCPSGCEAGYQPPACTANCASDKYGLNCEKDCGNCAQGNCNASNGVCISGCESGFMPPMCNEPCPSGKWGPSCVERCGECEGGAVCDGKTGACPNGKCKPYYQPPTCVNPCMDTYGEDCGQPCPKCRGGIQCDRSSGDCPFGCAPGYFPPACSKPCDAGKYGENCEMDCGNCMEKDCNPSDGKCNKGCDGPFEMPLCKDECYNNKWGDSCKNRCGHCKMCESCDVRTGQCANGCDPGYIAPGCTQKCDGQFGDECAETCGNCIDAKCHHGTGMCIEGCRKGWMPPRCLERIEQGAGYFNL